ARRQTPRLKYSSHIENQSRAQNQLAATLDLRSTPAALGPSPLSAQVESGRTQRIEVREAWVDNSRAFATQVAAIRPAAEDQKRLCNQAKQRTPPARRKNVAGAIAEFSMMRRSHSLAPGRP